MESSSHAAPLDYSNPAIRRILEDRSRLTHEVKNLTEDVAYLEEMLRRATRKRFASSSETQRHPDQRSLFNEAEIEASRDEDEDSQTDLAKPYRQAKRRGKPVRKALPKNLPVEEKVIDLADDKKTCPASGEPLVKIGVEITEQLDVEPAKAKILRTIRPKYVCHCQLCARDRGLDVSGGDSTVKVAELPAQAIPKSMAAPGLLAAIATNKYEYALPLNRQEGLFKRMGVELKRATMGSWMVRCGRLVQPLMNLMWEELLDSRLIYADETPLQVHKGTGKRPTAKSYMWTFMRGGRTGPPIVLYEVGPSRSHSVALRYLEEYEGYLHTDGYAAYDTLVGKLQKITHVGDWVHVRRRFDEAIKAQADPSSPSIRARVPFDLINELFRIEREMGDVADEVRLDIRQERSQPIVDTLKLWAEQAIVDIAPKSLTGVATRYMLGQWPKLLHFLKDPLVGLDTNPVENRIRPFVIGRRNWLFSDTLGGAAASGALYSLIVTAKANGLNAFDYLRSLFTELPKANTADEIEALLPWRWIPAT